MCIRDRLIGEQFVNTINPRTQIMQLLQCSLSFERMLQIFNSIGQANGERFLLMIDALNEGEGNLIWPNYLRGILNEISKYPWVACVISVRTENREEVIPKECEDILVAVMHEGFEESVDVACDKFFDYYNINLEVPMLTEEFSNPLYLKLFCESYSNSKEIRIVPSISEVFSNYINFVNKKLCQMRYYRYEESINLVQLCINEITSEMLRNDRNSLPYVEAYGIVNNITKSYFQISIPQYKNFLEALINENIFKTYRIYGCLLYTSRDIYNMVIWKSTTGSILTHGHPCLGRLSRQ